MFLLRKIFCIQICKWFVTWSMPSSLFFHVVLVSVSVGQFYHSFCVWWTDISWLWYSSTSFLMLMYCVYTYQRHYGLRGTSLWSTVLHFTGKAPHTQPWEHLWGKRRISFTLSFIPTSIFMAHFACSGGCYGPAELDPGILCSLFFYGIVAFFFFWHPLQMSPWRERVCGFKCRFLWHQWLSVTQIDETDLWRLLGTTN